MKKKNKKVPKSNFSILKHSDIEFREKISKLKFSKAKPGNSLIPTPFTEKPRVWGLGFGVPFGPPPFGPAPPLLGPWVSLLRRPRSTGLLLRVRPVG